MILLMVSSQEAGAGTGCPCFVSSGQLFGLCRAMRNGPDPNISAGTFQLFCDPNIGQVGSATSIDATMKSDTCGFIYRRNGKTVMSKIVPGLSNEKVNACLAVLSDVARRLGF